MQTETDSQGRFSFTQVPASRYTVRVHAAGFRDQATYVDLTSMPMAYLSFVLKPNPSKAEQPVSPEGAAASPRTNTPPAAREKLEKAQQLITEGKSDESIKVLKTTVEGYPECAEAYVLMGVAYGSRAKWKDAETSLRKALQLDPQSGPAYVVLGSVENEQQKYREAEKYLLKAAVLSPNAADVHSELGRTYWAQGRWQEAGQQVAKAIELRPDDAGQHVMMGNIQLRERNAEGALQEFQKAVQLDPNGPLAAPTRDMITRIENALKQAQNQKK